MKSYVFITGGIDGINGVVIYLNNKIKYLVKKGYQPFIFYFARGKVYVESLKKYAYQKSYLEYYPSSYNRIILNSHLNNIISECGGILSEDTIIETHKYHLACWGEALAEKIRCKHLHLLVTENPLILSESYYNFMKFKLDRFELFGMNEKTIPMLMKNYIDLDISEKYLLRTPCDNTVQDVDSRFIELVDKKADFRICTVSRLDKPYVIPMIDQVEQFCREKGVRVQLFFIGGAYNQSNIKRIHDRLRNNKYITYEITGFEYPVSVRLLHAMDVAIGCAGSVLTTYRSGLPTIALDVTDFTPIGIFGYTTKNTHYKEIGAKPITLSVLLTRILLNREVVVKRICPNYGDLSMEFDTHFEKINRSAPNKEYYNVSSVVNESGHAKRRIFIMKIIGPGNYCKFLALKNR